MGVEDIRRVTVVGAGLMGAGIAQVFAQAGLDVAQADVSDDALQRARERLGHGLRALVARDRITAAEADAIQHRIRMTTSLEDAARDAEFVVEAVTEDLEVKQRVFTTLDRTCPPRTILATNTSILSPTAIASVTARPDRSIGMHFMNPAPVIALVEVVPGLLTSDDTLATTKALAARIGKTPVVAREAPGGIVSRIMMAMRNEAVDILADGVATAEDIDAAMRLGAGFPIGPLALIDLVGVDLHVTNSDTMVRETGNAKYRPHPLLRKMVRAGLLGRKSGRGFYTYDEQGRRR